MFEATVLVPQLDNDGNRFEPIDFEMLELRLVELAGGFSRMGDVAGSWMDEGKRYDDVSRQYTVALESWMQLPAWLDIARWAAEHFRQEAMYIRVAGIPDVLRARG